MATQDFCLRILPVDWNDKEQLEEMANALRSLRLDALQLAPDAYASTYETEVEFPNNLWLQRLQNPQARHVVASLKRSGDGKEVDQVSRLEQFGQWIGLVVVMEKHGSERARATEEIEITRIPASVFYQLHGLFVHPSAQRCGLGRALIQESYNYVRTKIIEQGLLSARVDVLVDSWNASARNLYLSCGFEFVSQDSYDVGGSARIALSLSVVIRTIQLMALMNIPNQTVL